VTQTYTDYEFFSVLTSQQVGTYVEADE